MLAWGGNAWHLVEFGVALAAGIAAGSIALIGFGIDSLIEVFAAFVIVWLFSGGRGSSERAERSAQRLIAASYFVLVAYIGIESIRESGRRPPACGQLGGNRPRGRHRADDAAARGGETAGGTQAELARATVHEAEQNQICAYLSVALLVGL